MHDVLLIAIIAGLLSLDDRAGWQSLLGEPVFSSLLVGLATGHVAVALRCGVALQFAWLSVGAARGSRRPHVVAGGVVGAGAACLALGRTGDPRELYVIATAVFTGLLAGEAGAFVSRVAGEGRERWLASFDCRRNPPSPRETLPSTRRDRPSTSPSWTRPSWRRPCRSPSWSPRGSPDAWATPHRVRCGGWPPCRRWPWPP